MQSTPARLRSVLKVPGRLIWPPMNTRRDSTSTKKQPKRLLLFRIPSLRYWNFKSVFRTWSKAFQDFDDALSRLAIPKRWNATFLPGATVNCLKRSEERRVGKECSYKWGPRTDNRIS